MLCGAAARWPLEWARSPRMLLCDDGSPGPLPERTTQLVALRIVRGACGLALGRDERAAWDLDIDVIQ
eukprot:scaffold8844_cov55-Phaeocystis_antarctica.AAC.2